MADYPQPSSPGRSANMRAIRRTDTKPELVLRRALHKLTACEKRSSRHARHGLYEFPAIRHALLLLGCTAFSPSLLRALQWGPTGSKPLFLMAPTAAGDARNLMRARAASGCSAPTATPAENTVTF